MMSVRVHDLPDQIGSRQPREVLWCSECGAEFSAHSGDYWDVASDHIFTHCEVNMKLVIPYHGHKVVR